MDEVKSKFNQLQSKVTKLSNEKISLESEKRTLDENLKELVSNVLTLTGKKTLKESVEHYNKLELTLDEKTNKLVEELDVYLEDIDTGGE